MPAAFPVASNMPTNPPLPPHHTTHAGRNTAIVGGVLLMHGAALWALQGGLVRPPEIVVPAQILAEFIAPPAPPAAAPAPQPAPPAPPPPKPAPPKPRPQPTPPKPRPTQAPTPAPAPRQLVALNDSPTAPVVVAEPAPPPAPPPPPAAAPAGPPAPPASAPEKVSLPSSNAAYLNNPKPAYPAISRRLGESGRVVVRVLIGPDGRAKEAHVQRSSGYDRLDQVALETARDRWRYVPGTRNGVPEAMWFNVPINFVLE